MKNLHIFYGVSGSGKTIASSLLSEETLHTGIKKCTPIIRFDNIYDYEKEELDWVEIKRWCRGDDTDDFILDGFLIRPEWISKFRELFNGTIDLNYIFTDIDFLHETHKQKQAIPEYSWYRKEALYPDPTQNYEAIVINASSFHKKFLKFKNLFDCVILIKRDADGLHDSTEIDLKDSVHNSILRFIDFVYSHDENGAAVRIYNVLAHILGE